MGTKLRKTLKSMGTAPNFAVCALVVIIVRRGCVPFEGLKSIICGRECQLR